MTKSHGHLGAWKLSVQFRTANISRYLFKNSYHHSCERKIKLVLFYKDLNYIFLFLLDYFEIILSERGIMTLEQNWRQRKSKSDCLLISAYCELWTSESGSCVLFQLYSALRIILLSSSQWIQKIKRVPVRFGYSTMVEPH